MDAIRKHVDVWGDTIEASTMGDFVFLDIEMKGNRANVRCTPDEARRFARGILEVADEVDQPEPEVDEGEDVEKPNDYQFDNLTSRDRASAHIGPTGHVVIGVGHIGSFGNRLVFENPEDALAFAAAIARCANYAAQQAVD